MIVILISLATILSFIPIYTLKPTVSSQSPMTPRPPETFQVIAMTTQPAVFTTNTRANENRITADQQIPLTPPLQPPQATGQFPQPFSPLPPVLRPTDATTPIVPN